MCTPGTVHETTIGEERANNPFLTGGGLLSSESVEKHREAAPEHVRVAVLTISDTRAPENDTGGDVLQELMEGAGHEVTVAAPSSRTNLRASARRWLTCWRTPAWTPSSPQAARASRPATPRTRWWTV